MMLILLLKAFTLFVAVPMVFTNGTRWLVHHIAGGDK
jgi:hypothetical protein